MKKFGLLVFLTAIILGIFVSKFFSFGSFNGKIFNISFNKKTYGSGNLVSETRDISGFKGIEVSGVFQVEITAQKDFGVQVEADDNLQPFIRTEVRNGILHIEADRRFSTENGLKVRISAPDIESVHASGVAKVDVAGIKNDRLEIDTSGASKIKLSGETAKLRIDVSGASSIDGESLRAEDVEVEASGACHVSVFAVKDLRAGASGASKIIYSGNPQNVEKSASGASNVRQK